VSCGFDAHRDDPLAAMELSRAGFLALARSVRALADELCGGRIAFVLEGGYAASGLRDGTSAVLQALTEPSPGAVPVPEAPPGAPCAGSWIAWWRCTAREIRPSARRNPAFRLGFAYLAQRNPHRLSSRGWVRPQMLSCQAFKKTSPTQQLSLLPAVARYKGDKVGSSGI
jgi:hypothetical protein